MMCLTNTLLVNLLRIIIHYQIDFCNNFRVCLEMVVKIKLFANE